MYDFRKTVSDQLIFSHYHTVSEFLKLYDAGLVAEAGGPGPPIWNTCPVDALKALGNVTIPRGEFWIRHRNNMFLIKEIASASHIYGKKIVDAESFTTWRRWKDSPFKMKKYADRAFCEGLNNITFHTFASTNPEDGLPGRTYHAGSDINSGTTWWEKSRPFMDYLSRCSYMLQQGLFVADVCYYYGDQAPNFFPAYHDVPKKPMIPGLGKGYDYDVVNSDVILNSMCVKDGKIVLPDGMSYRIMLLPQQDHMPLEVLVRDDIVKDFSFSGPSEIDYIHRTTGSEEIYSLRNEKDEKVKSSCNFRVSEKYPELWYPSTGQIHRIDNFSEETGTIGFDVELPAHGSVFVVFSNKKKRKEIPPVIQPQKESVEKLIDSPWEVHFPEGWGAPPKAIFEELISWIDSEDTGIKYFSGTAAYFNSFFIDHNRSEEKILDLGEMRDVAEVFINGKSAGILWKKPFSVDITDLVKKGENELKIEVV